MSLTFIVDRDFNNSRLDKWFKEKVLNIPQSLIEKIIRKKKVKVNNKKTKTSYRIKEGDTIKVFDIENYKSSVIKKNIKYIPSTKEKNKYGNFIIENNENFIVLNKPNGIAVQGGTKSFKNLIDILNNTKFFEDTKPYIVHRLDKETSGIIIVAKNKKYAQLFTSLFRIRKIHKTYIAITNGILKFKKKTLIDNLILEENKKKIVQKAISHIKVLKTSDSYSLVELNPITGRKHQLRKQLFRIGSPIVGDTKYSFIKNKKESKLMLHARKIKFMINNQKYEFVADYDTNFNNFIKKKFKNY